MVAGNSLSVVGAASESKIQSRNDLVLAPEMKLSVRSFLHEIVDKIISSNLQRAGNSDVYNWSIAVVFDESRFTQEASKPIQRIGSVKLKTLQSDLLKYVKSIQISLVQPQTAPASLIEAIRSEISSNADLRLAAIDNPEQLITVVTDRQTVGKLNGIGIQAVTLLNAYLTSIRSFQYWPVVVTLGVGCLLVLILVKTTFVGFEARRASKQDFRNRRLQYLSSCLNSLNRRQLQKLKNRLSESEVAVCAYVLPLAKTNDFLETPMLQDVFYRIEQLNNRKISPRVLSRIFEKIAISSSESC